jgi:hypothetical protein
MAGARHNLERLLQSAYDFQCRKEMLDNSDPKPKFNMGKLIWSWPVVGGALFFILGGGLTFMTSGHPVLADVCYVLGAGLFTAKFITWEENINQPQNKSRKTTAIAIGLTLMVLIFSVVGNYKLNPGKIEVPQTTKSRPYTGIGPFGDTPPDATSVPDFFDVDLGGNTLRLSKSSLAQQVPIIGGTVKQPCQLSIGFNTKAALMVNATLYDLNRQVLGVVKENQFDKQDIGLDRNWDRSGFEIVDPKVVVQLQVDHRTRGVIRIRGLFVTSPNYVVAITDDGVYGQTESVGENVRIEGDLKAGKNVHRTAIQPIFKYPSSKFFGIRAEYP